MIDERLAYHQFLSSDKPLDSIEDLATDSKDRPDVLVFDNPMAFVDGENEDYSSVVIIEFKRPMRNDYRNEEKKNPIDQVLDYILNIQSGSHTDGHGRLIQVTEQTPFYVYIICDLTPTLKRQAIKSNFKTTPDRKGYFFLHSELNAYIEIISFSKLVSDAKRRNQVLFDQLNLQ
jgi:hypothetical protein